MARKNKIVSLSWNLVPILIRICGIQWWCSLFCLRSEIPFLGKFDPKYQNFQYKLKFGTWTNSNMQNALVMFTFPVFIWNYPFWAKLSRKNKIVRLGWYWVSRLIRIFRIQWQCSLFLISTGNKPLWTKLVQKST